MKTQAFVVDAALLQELGERLIGRAPIALAELVKNSYDADAGTCRIEFAADQITISDDGAGMSEKEFLEHWMRLGTTHKVDKRVSPSGRSLTGSKGIGRLSVQFLADEMTLESTSGADPNSTLLVLVDWSKVVRGQDLDSVDVLWEMVAQKRDYPDKSPTGTRITLKKLKSAWDAESIQSLGEEVWRLRSPFKRSGKTPKVRRPEEFDVEIEAPEIVGARDAFDKVQQTLFGDWRARIKGTLDQGRSGGKASITVEFRDGYPESSSPAATYRETVSLPIRQANAQEKALVDQARFEILIFKTEGRQPGGISVGELREYLKDFGNVSVYDSGFRLPYYGSGRDASGQDWLSIALDQGRRLSTSELLPEHLRTQNKYLLDLPAPGRIFGAVEIDTNHERAVALRTRARPGQSLQIQPGRDRLHDNRAFAQLRDLVRFSLDFYANRYRLRALKAVESERDKEPASRKYDRVVRLLEGSKAELPRPIFREIVHELADARKAALRDERVLDRRAAIFAPLATAGMTALALNHELAREIRLLATMQERLRDLAKAHSLVELESIADEFADAESRLKSLREIFAPLASDVDSEASDRLKVRSVVDQTVNAMRVLMPGVDFDPFRIPGDLRFPIGSLAEWSALLQNVLTNAWNAMLDTPKPLVMFRGHRDARGNEWLRISDTGKGLGVSLEESAELFEPFERRLEIGPDQRSIAIGGQGLGLAIVRMIAQRRATSVRFVPPEPEFATTFELSWKGGKK